MPEYQAPGVYVEELPALVRPIAGVGTSVAGFIGEIDPAKAMPSNPAMPGEEYKRTPAGEPRLVTNWEEFRRRFGEVGPFDGELPGAVYGFFDNGGTRCWVIGLDNLDAPAKGDDPVTNALNRLGEVDEVSLVVVPLAAKLTPQRRATIRSQVLLHCEKLAERFAILDGEPEAENTASSINPAAIAGGEGGDKGGSTTRRGFGAIYHPWIAVRVVESGGHMTATYQPPSGHIAGVYARVDAERGVHKAPANEIIRGALGVRRPVSREHQAGLNPGGLNALRMIDGNVTIWGARTLGGDANGEWKYVNVRRLVIFLSESLQEGLNWVVFESNDAALWARVRRNIGAFLTNVWRDGALFGAKPSEAFFVRCDSTNNPPEVREAGRLVVEVGVAIVKPAEFVIIRLTQSAGPLS